MTIVDHLFVLLLLVAQPVHGAYAHRKYIARVRAGTAESRAKLYRDIHVFEWTALTVLVVTWFLFERPLTALGFRVDFGAGFLMAAAIVVAICVYLLIAIRSVRRSSSEERDAQIEALGDLKHFVPQTQADYRRFIGVSVTAGIVEETLYRGFLFWYLLQFAPMWTAVIVSSVIFALGHSYQGIGGMLRVFVVGIVAGVLYALSGSIWLVMVAHALFDILQGWVLVELFQRPPASGPRRRDTSAFPQV